jgi:hypothetical protein
MAEVRCEFECGVKTGSANSAMWGVPAEMTAGIDAAVRDVAPAIERHYSVAQVAELWGWSETKVREVFRDEPGVLQSQLRTLRPRKRQNITLRIPESVLFRVHERMTVRG